MRGVIENVLGRIDNATLHLLSRPYLPSLFMFGPWLFAIEYVVDSFLGIGRVTISGCFASGVSPYVNIGPPFATVPSGRFHELVEFLTRLLLCQLQIYQLPVLVRVEIRH